MTYSSSEVPDFFEWLRRLAQGIPHIYEGIEIIAGDGPSDDPGDLLVGSVVPIAPDRAGPDTGSLAITPDQTEIRPVENLNVSQIVRNSFDKKGSMSTAEVFSHLEKTGEMAKIRAVYKDKARVMVMKTIYEMRKEGLLTRKNQKAATPWDPTDEFNVRQNHRKATGNMPSVSEEPIVVAPPSEGETKNPASESPSAAA